MSSIDIYKTKDEAITHARTINNLEHRAIFCSQHGIPFDNPLSLDYIKQVFMDDMKDHHSREIMGEDYGH